jgi:hypothetical protein
MFGPGSTGEIALLDGKRTHRDRRRPRGVRPACCFSAAPTSRRSCASVTTRPCIIAFPARAAAAHTQTWWGTPAFLSVPTRLAKQLAALAGGHDGEGRRAGGKPTVRMSQEELAHTLGVSREIVSRQLAMWREAGVVEIGRGWITVHDIKALDRIVAGG